MFMRMPFMPAAATLCGACFMLATALVHADERHPGDATPSYDAAPRYDDSADIPTSDPALRPPQPTEPQDTEQQDFNLRQEPSVPTSDPGSERDSLVPIPDDNNGRIDPQ